MAAEGVFPKINGDIFYASEANNTELYSNIARMMIQTTKLTKGGSSSNSGFTDVRYNYGQSDFFFDLNGYNNTVNNSQTSARYTGSCYIIGGSLYDSFDDNNINFNLWTTGTTSFGDRGFGSILEVGGVMRIVGSAHNVAVADAAQSGLARLWSDVVFNDYLYWLVPTLSQAQTSLAQVIINGQVVLDSGTSQIDGNYGTTGSWEIVNVSGNDYKIFKNGVLVKSYTGVIKGGSVEWNALSTCFGGGANSFTIHEIDNVHFGHWPGSNTVVLSGTSFVSTVKSLFADASYIGSNAGITITYDASSNSGSAYQKSDVGIGSWSDTLNAGSNVAIRFKLNNTGSFTPMLFGYSYIIGN